MTIHTYILLDIHHSFRFRPVDRVYRFRGGAAGISLPFILLGTVLGSTLYGSIGDEVYRRLILILMPLLGLLMIWRGLNL